MRSIHRITPEMVEVPPLRAQIYRDPLHELYWSDLWDPDFYVSLARAGFICIAFEHPELGPLLIPEMQGSFAVLDWEDLHCSRKLRRLLRSDRLAEEAVELRVTQDPERVLEALREYHPGSWILEEYEEIVRMLPAGGDPWFSVRAIELWSGRRQALAAGELGYTIGSTYTSLSGFCSSHDPELQHFGTLQLYLLAEWLRDHGYAFWNLGQTEQEYKRSLGARPLPRSAFLDRWMEARDRPPAPR